MDYRIGILGSNGKVGVKLCNYLEKKGINFVKASRSDKKTLDGQCIFDIYNKHDFETFLKNVDIVVNCIGPTFYYGQFIAEKVIKHNKIYIDVFGDEFILRNIQSDINSLIVISAGDCPGFSGIISCWIKKRYFSKISKIDMSYFSGGEITASGLLDILISVNMGYGQISHYYKSKRYKREKNYITKKYIEYLDRGFYCNGFISNEMVDVSNFLNIDEMHFNNLYSSEEEYLLLKDIYYKLPVKDNCWENVKGILTNEFSYINNSNFDGSLYKIEVEGEKNGKNKALTLEIILENSYTISAYILYKIIQEILYSSKLNIGILRPFELIDSEVIFSEMTKLRLINDILEVENTEYDEGCL